MQDFEMTLGPQGKPKFSAPEGRHDDCVISLALAVFGLSGGGIGAWKPQTDPYPKGW
jgi:hypothetical protein